MPGLKDHQISELTNAIRNKLELGLVNPPQCLREMIVSSILEYLKKNNLRIDTGFKKYKEKRNNG